MKTKPCDPLRIDAFLQGNLNPAQEAEFTQHLDRCEICRTSLEDRAAEPFRWEEAKSMLASPRCKQIPLPNEEMASKSLPLPVRQIMEVLAPTDEPTSLGRLDSFEVLAVIGCGAMGVVLKASDRSLNRIVALKIMHPSLAVCGTARQRFAREAQAAAGVLHRNVVAIHSVSAGRSLPYLVMPYLKGGSLQQKVDRDGPLSLPEILRVGSQLAAGLAAAHQQGLIHRDIKPANIMLDDGVETVVITDFGLARAIDDATMTRSGVITGTPEFMSPEQARGESIDFSSDLFSLGSVLYVLCTGRAPFRAESAFGVLRRITDEHPKLIRDLNSEIPLWLCGIIAELQSKRPESRPSAESTHTLLQRCLAHVHQPDQIKLPAELETPSSLSATVLSRPFQIGVLVMALFSIFLAFAYALLPPSVQDIAPEKKDVTTTTAKSEAIGKKFVTAFASSDEIGTLNVDIKRGAITVVGHDSSEVIVELDVPNYRPPSSNEGGLTELRPNNLDFDITTSGNEIKVDSNSQQYITNLKISVPRSTNLVLDSYRDGKLQVTKVDGRLNVRSFYSHITLTDCSGSADLYSYHGNLVASMNSINPDRPLEFESYNGSIDLSLPADIQVNTQLRAGHGKLLTDFVITEFGDPVQTEIRKDGISRIQFDKFVRGTINGGGSVLKAESEHGDIRIQRRMTGLGQRLGREWNEKLGKPRGQEWNERLGPKLGQEWNEKLGDKLGDKLGKKWNERLNGDGGAGK